MKKTILILFLVTISLSKGFSQTNSVLDSLKPSIKIAKHDTIKLRMLSEMIDAESDDKIWSVYNEQMKLIAEKLLTTKSPTSVTKTAKKYLAEVFNNMGYIYDLHGDISNAIEFYSKSLKIKEEIDDKQGISSSLNNIASIYRNQGDIPKALETFGKSLKIFEEIGDKKGIAYSLNNIGYIYDNLGDLSKSLEYYNRGLKNFEEVLDNGGIAMSMINIGGVYKKHGNNQKASEYYNNSLKIREEIGDKSGVANSLNNIGFIYQSQGDFAKALEIYFKSLKIFEEVGDKTGTTISLNAIGSIYLNQNKLEKSLGFYKKSYQISKDLGYPENIKYAANGLKKVYVKLGNYKLAYGFHLEELQMLDSIQNEANYKASVQQRTKYEYEKKAATDSIANAKEKEIKDIAIAKQKVELKAKRNQQFALYSGLLLVLLFAGFVFNRLKITQKQKVLIEEQKQLVEEKHKEITDSINYAERIQRSFLATTEMLDKYLGVTSSVDEGGVSRSERNYFVFFRPKDVVSGDFYWAGELNNGNFAFSVADSTGHGVPGAIMSILNISSLEKSIEQETAPDQILNKTRKIIIERLKKDGSSEGGKDGMDCSLLVLNQDRTQLSFAAANNPVFILRPIVIAREERTKQSHSNEQIASLPSVVRNDGYELIEFKPDKMPVGKHDNDKESFTLHSTMLKKGDVIYSLTDGFPDQFGGDKGKKYMIKNLKELLLQIAHLPVLAQEQKLAEEFDKWKGSNEQVDDVCIIGVRV